MNDHTNHDDVMEGNNAEEVPVLAPQNKLGLSVESSAMKNLIVASDNVTSDVNAEVQASASLSEIKTAMANSLEPRNGKVSQRELRMDALRQRVEKDISFIECFVPELSMREQKKRQQREKDKGNVDSRGTLPKPKVVDPRSTLPRSKAVEPHSTTLPKPKVVDPRSTLPRPKAVFDDNGKYISDGRDLCDCLDEDCCGCFFPCPKCSSNKCGPECRVNRVYKYDACINSA